MKGEKCIVGSLLNIDLSFFSFFIKEAHIWGHCSWLQEVWLAEVWLYLFALSVVVSHSVVSNSATSWTVAYHAPLSMGILQARILEHVAIPFSRESSWPRDGTQVSCIAGWFFTVWAKRKAHIYGVPTIICKSLHEAWEQGRIWSFPKELWKSKPNAVSESIVKSLISSSMCVCVLLHACKNCKRYRSM